MAVNITDIIISDMQYNPTTIRESRHGTRHDNRVGIEYRVLATVRALMHRWWCYWRHFSHREGITFRVFIASRSSSSNNNNYCTILTRPPELHCMCFIVRFVWYSLLTGFDWSEAWLQSVRENHLINSTGCLHCIIFIFIVYNIILLIFASSIVDSHDAIFVLSLKSKLVVLKFTFHRITVKTCR